MPAQQVSLGNNSAFVESNLAVIRSADTDQATINEAIANLFGARTSQIEDLTKTLKGHSQQIGGLKGRLEVLDANAADLANMLKEREVKVKTALMGLALVGAPQLLGPKIGLMGICLGLPAVRNYYYGELGIEQPPIQLPEWDIQDLHLT